MKEKEILHLGSAIVNMNHVALVREIETKDEETTVEVISSSGENLPKVNLPKGKRLKDFTLFGILPC
ncbi:MAG TPA: hypothetical protein VGC76_20110 [Pyrinomonadaceae bacterium]|jgi:hypothetical protein